MRGNTPKRIVKWAILGTGSIANDMVQCLKQLDSCEVVTVGSRSYDNAKWFQTKWNIPRSYDSYTGAAADEEVDVCYIATPMERHFQDCMSVIQLGKAVLCEKSMAPNHIIANEIIQSAKDANVLFVHGVWSRFFPAMQKVKNLVESSAIGEVKSARASFCQSFRAGECSALLEVGIYCVQFLQWVLDDPNSFMKPTIRGAFEKMSVDGVYDEYVNATIEFPHGKVGTMECSLGYCSERSAAVYGTTGVIEIPYPFWCPTEIKVTKMTGPGSQQMSKPKVYQFPLPANVSALQCTDNKGNTMIPGFNFVHSEGLWYEAAEVNRCFLNGLLESPLFPSSQCHDILRLVSDIQKYSRLNPIATNSPRKRKSQMQKL